ncbi:hypothetical protein ACLOJK_005702 [Asimina triloba]
MPPKTPTVRKKIVKTTAGPKATTSIPPLPETAISPATNSQTAISSPPPKPISEKATTSPKLISPEFSTTITASPETATALEANTTPKTRTAVSRKTVVRKTPATPKSSSRIVGTAAETSTSPETYSAVAPKAPDAASDANTVVASGAAAGTDASTETSVNAPSEATANLENASDPQTSGAPNAADETSTATGTNSTVEAAAAANDGSAENAAKISKPKTTIKVIKKIVKRKKIIRKPVGAPAQLPPKEEEKAESNPNPQQQRQQLEENGIPDLNSPPSPLCESPASSKMADPVSPPPAMEEPIHDTQIVENESEKGDSNQALENESKKENLNQAVENESVKEILSAAQDDEAMISERRRRRKTEVFIGGLDKDAKEEDIRKVFEKVGEIPEIRLMMNSQTGKNKGYAFLRYASAADAKRAVTELAKVEGERAE